MKKDISIRKDWKLIESLIESNSRILDIGCGDGGLINQLERNIFAKTSDWQESFMPPDGKQNI